MKFCVRWLNANYQPCVCFNVVAVSESDAKLKVQMRGVVERFISVEEG